MEGIQLSEIVARERVLDMEVIIGGRTGCGAIIAGLIRTRGTLSIGSATSEECDEE